LAEKCQLEALDLCVPDTHPASKWVRNRLSRIALGHVARRRIDREPIKASGAAAKLRSAPILVSASAVPPEKAAVAKKSDTVNPTDAVMPTSSTSPMRSPEGGSPQPGERYRRRAESRTAFPVRAQRARNTSPARSARTARQHSRIRTEEARTGQVAAHHRSNRLNVSACSRSRG
jgi:hypothetical protein